jgi:thiamine-monophosphate kinase
MAAHEFAIIERYFKSLSGNSEGVVLGSGDDCAVLSVPEGMELCVSTDTLVEGVHFLPDAAAELVAARTMGANLSDLAAMGARPHSFLLAITMPSADERWLEAFSETLRSLISEYRVPLVGGNLSKGQLAVTITIMGTAPESEAVRRTSAAVGDDIYVTGTLGDAARGLELLRDGESGGFLVSRYAAPTPRLEAGERLRQVARAMIDISDGLYSDLGHIVEASHCGAIIDGTQLPLSGELVDSVGEDSATRLALFAGDDYELCFTASPDDANQIADLSEEIALPITRVGTVVEGDELVALDQHNQPIEHGGVGYQHF